MAQTALRKMGNSTGIILPRAILSEIGLATGAALDLRVENGKLIATPVKAKGREGWETAAAEIGAHEDVAEAEWQGFANEDDADLTW